MEHLPARLFIIGLLWGCTALLRAWGPGHDEIAREVLDRLPPWVVAGLDAGAARRVVEEFSHHPDSFAPIDATEAGAAGRARLAALGIVKRYDLHGERGRAAVLIELVHACRERDSRRTAFWAAVLSHVVADLSACNHDPLVHQVTYDWAPARNLVDRSGVPLRLVLPLLDLGCLRDDPEGRRILHKTIGTGILPDRGEGAEDALQTVMAYGHEGARISMEHSHGVLIGALGRLAGDPDATRLHRESLATLGAWAVVRTLHGIAMAERLATCGQVPVLDSQAEAEAKRRFDAATRSVDLANDPLAAGLAPAGMAAAPAIGVVLEPSWCMEQSVLGFPGRVLAAAIARSLTDRGRPTGWVDPRSLLNGHPDPSRVPVLVICGTAASSVGWMEQQALRRGLAAYRAAGGRVLWLGGAARPPAELGPFPALAARISATAAMPVEPDSLAGIRVRIPDGGTWTCRQPPLAAEGWQRAPCPWRFPGGQGLVPLLVLEDDQGTTSIVGALHPGKSPGDPPAAWLPAWCLAPGVMDPDRTIATSAPSLDRVGAAILERAMAGLDAPTGDAVPHQVR